MRVAMSDLNDQSEGCFDHPSPSLLVSLLTTCGQLNLLLRSQQRGLADLSKVNLNIRLRIVSHAPTSPQIGSEATAGSVEEHQLISDAIRKGLTEVLCFRFENGEAFGRAFITGLEDNPEFLLPVTL